MLLEGTFVAGEHLHHVQCLSVVVQLESLREIELRRLPVVREVALDLVVEVRRDCRSEEESQIRAAERGDDRARCNIYHFIPQEKKLQLRLSSVCRFSTRI